VPLEQGKRSDVQDKLKLILEGEQPHDIFVRWKPLEQQPIGWHPDLNDGVRLNIRPFIEAGVLRKTSNGAKTAVRTRPAHRGARTATTTVI